MGATRNHSDLDTVRVVTEHRVYEVGGLVSIPR